MKSQCGCGRVDSQMNLGQLDLKDNSRSDSAEAAECTRIIDDGDVRRR